MIFVLNCFVVAIFLYQQAASDDYLIVPGKRVGPITKSFSESDLKQKYGESNVSPHRVHVGEGEMEEGTIVFQNEKIKKIEIRWFDPIKKRYPKEIKISGSKSVWKTANGITLGSQLSQVEKLNGRPFKIFGFGWDYAGFVTSWERGKLVKQLPLSKQIQIQFGFPDNYNKNIDASSIETVNEISSQSAAVLAIDPVVVEMRAVFDKSEPD